MVPLPETSRSRKVEAAVPHVPPGSCLHLGQHALGLLLSPVLLASPCQVHANAWCFSPASLAFLQKYFGFRSAGLICASFSTIKSPFFSKLSRCIPITPATAESWKLQRLHNSQQDKVTINLCVFRPQPTDFFHSYQWPINTFKANTSQAPYAGSGCSQWCKDKVRGSGMCHMFRDCRFSSCSLCLMEKLVKCLWVALKT